jgi:hypothetical protein
VADAARLREKAVEIQALAGLLTDPAARQEMLSVALGYAMMAERIERNGTVLIVSAPSSPDQGKTTSN